MQVVAASPTWVRIEDVPAEVARTAQGPSRWPQASGKPAEVVEKIVEGKLAKFYEENCLLEQPYIKDESVKIKDLITADDRQAGRKHLGAPLRPPGSRRLS